MRTKVLKLALALMTPGIILIAATAFAQEPADAAKEIAVPVTEVALGCHPAWNDPLIINDQEALNKALDKADTNYCKLDRPLKINFQKYTFLAFTRFADCQAMLSMRVTKDTEKKLLVVSLEERYGGCRGMTAHSFSFLVEKLPPDYSVQFKEPRRVE